MLHLNPRTNSYLLNKWPKTPIYLIFALFFFLRKGCFKFWIIFESIVNPYLFIRPESYLWGYSIAFSISSGNRFYGKPRADPRKRWKKTWFLISFLCRVWKISVGKQLVFVLFPAWNNLTKSTLWMLFVFSFWAIWYGLPRYSGATYGMACFRK